MLSSILDKFETEINDIVYVWPGCIWKICLVFVFLLHMFDFTYTVMQGIMGKAGTRNIPKLTAGGLKQNPLKKTHTPFLCSIYVREEKRRGIHLKWV